MKEKVSVLIDAQVIEDRLQALAEQIAQEYAGKKLTLVCILKGGVMFMVDLAKKINLGVEFEFMSISSYNNTESTGIIKIDMDLKCSINGKDVILVEDIIDTGRTLSHLLKHLESKNPASLRICTLLDKPDRRVVEGITPAYVGFVIPDKFVVGYGLDYNQKYRNLNYIGALEFLD